MQHSLWLAVYYALSILEVLLFHDLCGICLLLMVTVAETGAGRYCEVSGKTWTNFEITLTNLSCVVVCCLWQICLCLKSWLFMIWLPESKFTNNTVFACSAPMVLILFIKNVLKVYCSCYILLLVIIF